MEGSNGGSNAPAPFLTKTYEMVEDPMTNSVVSWSHSCHSFVVWNPPEFARDLLPKYFKHNNFSSFIRQLNTYGFRKVDPEQWEFANEEFIRGQQHLLKNIYRRKPIHSHSGQGSSAAQVNDPERQEFEEEIERLKRDNGLLQSELERHKQESREFRADFGSLGQRLKDIDCRQKQLLSYLAQLLQHSEGHSRKRRLIISNDLNDEATNDGESRLLTFKDENPSTLLPMLNKLDSSLNFWENFSYRTCQASVEESYDFGVAPLPPSPGDSDVNLQQCSSNSVHSSPSRGFRSSPELAVSSDHVDSLDRGPKSSGIDMNTSPSNFVDSDVSKDRVEDTMPASALAADNDVFWQQFLTETPVSVSEIQSERRDLASKTNDSGSLEDLSKPWWIRNNLDNLTQQMGRHLNTGRIRPET